MKIVLAPDSFKGSLSAKQVCDAMEQGIRRAYPNADVLRVPMADGGEGTVESLVDATVGTFVQVEVTDPLGGRVTARYGILDDGATAVIEMAEASGLTLVPPNLRNPLVTTTYGTGELIAHALSNGCRNFILAIGGSATNDGGVGMAQALGFQFLDSDGLDVPFGGGGLATLARIDSTCCDERLFESTFTVACDVDSPLCGSQGASFIFGPQKGATPDMVRILDDNLFRLANVVKRDLGIDVQGLPGGGAAGGLGAGSVAFLGAKLRRGVETVLEIVGLEDKIQGANLVLSGEGQVDHQTLHGKTPYGVAQVAFKHHVPVILLAGSVGEGVERLYEHGVRSVFSIVSGPMTLENAVSNARDLVADTAERVVRAVFG